VSETEYHPALIRHGILGFDSLDPLYAGVHGVRLSFINSECWDRYPDLRLKYEVLPGWGPTGVIPKGKRTEDLV
jgi:hypothetical protein